MHFILNAAEMKDCDNRTSEWKGIPSIVLMERAALAVVEELEEAHVDLSNTVVFCGSGNNGGDGIAIARILSERYSNQGVKVTVIFLGKMDSCTEQTRMQMAIADKCHIKILYEISDEILNSAYTTVIDAIFGIGLSRTIEGRYKQAIEQINQMNAYKVAVDISSGIHADTGKVMGCAIKADRTITFAFLKRGMLLYPGAEYSGIVKVKDIGITQSALTNEKASMFTYDQGDLKKLLPLRKPDSNKGTYGKIALVVGSTGMAGAACLSGESALRMGCGMVRIITSEENRVIIQSLLPEAILTTYKKEHIDEDSIRDALLWADVIGIGSGMGTDDIAKQLLTIALSVAESENMPVVADADALNLFARNMDMIKNHSYPLTITPHIGEMARLTGTKIQSIKENLVECATEFADKYQLTCVLKDARTVVAGTQEPVYLNLSGNHGMSTAGSGDVLLGIIGGLTASGMSGMQAASTGVYIHGLAGNQMIKEKGTRGLLARDIITGIPLVLRSEENETI